MRQAVAPVLQELGGRARVIDLVEVHLLRLVEPEGPQDHRADHEYHDDPQIEPVEPPTALVPERGGPVRSDGWVAVPGP